jgi:hypothetical protein
MLYDDPELPAILRSAKLGLIQPPPILEEFRRWTEAELGVGVLYIRFERLEFGPTIGRPRLRIVLETEEDYKSWHWPDTFIRPDIHQRVYSHFKSLAGAHPSEYDTKGLFLVVNCFMNDCRCLVCSEFLKNDSRSVITAFADVPIWRIDGLGPWLAVFLNTKADIAINEENGTCAEITARCLAEAKKYDEFGYFSEANFRLIFDSKENVDKNFNGHPSNWWRG